MSETRTARHFASGQWTNGPDPIMEAWDELGTVDITREDDVLEKLGFHYMFGIGERLLGGFAAWKRTNDLYVLVFDTDECMEYLYFETLHDLYDACTRWASLIRDIELTDLVRELKRDEKHLTSWDDDVVAAIARRVTEGSQQRYRGPERPY